LFLGEATNSYCQAVSAVRSRSCGITVDPPALTQPSFKKLITHYYLSVGLLF